MVLTLPPTKRSTRCCVRLNHLNTADCQNLTHELAAVTLDVCFPLPGAFCKRRPDVGAVLAESTWRTNRHRSGLQHLTRTRRDALMKPRESSRIRPPNRRVKSRQTPALIPAVAVDGPDETLAYKPHQRIRLQ